MTEGLGYPGFMAGGGDGGSPLSQLLGVHHPESIIGLHLTDQGWHTNWAEHADLSEGEQQYLQTVEMTGYTEGAYAMLQGTRPQTLGFGLNDSPVGMAFAPNDLMAPVPPRELVSRTLKDIRQWTVLDRGGHFAAMEFPQLLAEDLRKFLRTLNKFLDNHNLIRCRIKCISRAASREVSNAPLSAGFITPNRLFSVVMELIFKPVNTENLKDLEKLFESRGGPHNCWCMVWRKMKTGAVRSSKSDKKDSFKNYVDQKIPTGILCYFDEEPIAWCSIAPRDSYRNLSGVDSLQSVWSLVCFYIKKAYRRQGITEKLITAAVTYANENGAKYVEAYPVEPDSPSYRFMGFTTTFEKLGFDFRHKAGKRRRVMTMQL